MYNVILNTLTGLASRIFLNPAFLEWLIRYSARKLAEHTKTPHDDAVVEKIEEILDSYKEPVKK